VKFIIANRIILSRAPEGPLARYIVPFVRSMREQGCARYSLYRQALLAACFSEWLRRREVALRGSTSDHPQQYLRYRARRVRPSRGDAAALRHLVDFLRGERVIPAEKQVPADPRTHAERCTQAYEQHLREARGLARATIIN
jgi:integrase/recombinase XerD